MTVFADNFFKQPALNGIVVDNHNAVCHQKSFQVRLQGVESTQSRACVISMHFAQRPVKRLLPTVAGFWDKVSAGLKPGGGGPALTG